MLLCGVEDELDAVRWGAASTADLKNIQSQFRSGIDIEDYQLDPVVRAIQIPRVNLLIADDVGLGKTIEAGLVALKLIIRHRARRVLVVCPASLQVQWRDQMRDKFGLDFRIVDSELMRDLRRRRGIHVNPWSHFPRLITSLDFLKRERPLRLFKETLPAEGESIYPRHYDVLIVDEAHNCAPAGRGKYATDSLRTGAIRLLASHFEHKLFLTSTPIARTGAGTSTGSARSRASRPRSSRLGSSWPASTGTSTTSRGSSSSTGVRPTAAMNCGSTNSGLRARWPTFRSSASSARASAASPTPSVTRGGRNWPVVKDAGRTSASTTKIPARGSSGRSCSGPRIAGFRLCLKQA
jgi:hypothetical protein